MKLRGKLLRLFGLPLSGCGSIPALQLGGAVALTTHASSDVECYSAPSQFLSFPAGEPRPTISCHILGLVRAMIQQGLVEAARIIGKPVTNQRGSSTSVASKHFAVQVSRQRDIENTVAEKLIEVSVSPSMLAGIDFAKYLRRLLRRAVLVIGGRNAVGCPIVGATPTALQTRLVDV